MMLEVGEGGRGEVVGGGQWRRRVKQQADCRRKK